MPLDAIVPDVKNVSNTKNGPSYNADFDILSEGSEDSNIGDDKVNEENTEETEHTEDKDVKKDKKKTKKEDKKDDSEEDDSEEENEEDETEDETEDDDTEEDTEEDIKDAFHRPTIKDIKTKYPEFFKDFPELKESYFRELEFTKIFPTVDEAKEAFNDNEAFNVLSEAALGGDPVPIIDSLDKTDKKALEVFSLSFLPALFKKNQETYYTVITPILENALRQAFKDGDQNMKDSASNVAQFFFGKDGDESVQGKKTLSKNVEITAEQKKLNDTRDANISEAFRKTVGQVETEIDRSLGIIISKQLDPDKSMSKLLRGNLSEEVIKRIKKQLLTDNSHMSVMSARWKRARNNGYTEDDKSKIISTFLARAKSLVPLTSEKVRLAAMGKNVKKQEPVIHKEVNGGRPINGRPEKEKVNYRKMSDMDILNS